MTRLYACLYVPAFAVAAVISGRLRGERNLQTPPALVFSGTEPNRIVYGANAGARSAGIHEGMPLEQAQARFAIAKPAQQLEIYPRDEQAEARMQKELLEAALTISPRVEDSAPGLLTVDLAGLENPHASADILHQKAEQLGLPVHVAVSQNRFVALCAARTHEGVTHIFSHQARGFLKDLPLEILPLEEKERAVFERWGIGKVGELARLPLDSLVARFGGRGACLAKLARGEDDTLFAAWQEPSTFEERQEFDWPLGNLDQLSFPLADLLRNLCARLRNHGFAAESVRVALKRSDGVVFERIVALSYPLAEPQALLKLIRLDLAANPPGEMVEGVTVAAQPTPRRFLQHDLFLPARPRPEQLAVTLVRLAHLVGADRVGSPAVVDTHRPRAFEVASFAPPREGRKAVARGRGKTGTVRFAPLVADAGKGRSRAALGTVPDFSRESGLTRQRLKPEISRQPAMAFRCFRPAVEAEIIVRGKRPIYVNGGQISGPVRACAGPWRVCGEWWTDDVWAYEEWDVEVAEQLYRVCCELASRTWHVAGVYG
ncbi:MAG: DNA polymerase Y family protein [Acidobacteria bacterium]|nr:DNA polymerase Y family protein [Acidobacteriota bacterium]